MNDYIHVLWPHREPTEPIVDRRARLLDVAATHFYEKGYASTTTRDIALTAGILKGSIYHYFSSKEEMLFNIIWTTHRAIKQDIARVRPLTDDPALEIKAILQHHALFNAKNLAWTTVFYNDFRSLNDEHRGRVIRERDAYEAVLRGLVERGQDSGQLISSVPSKLVVYGFLGLLNSLHRWYKPEGDYGAEEVASFFVTMALHGLVEPGSLSAKSQVTD